MEQVLDFHLHSKYSRACSPRLTLANLEATCRIKGVDIIGTADFTYPAWFKSIDQELEEIDQSGLYRLKAAFDDKVKFLLSTELSLIYKDKGKTRRIHLVVHAPNVAAVKELNTFLDKHYNIRSDGRPILGMKAPELVKLLLKIHPQFLIYPAHIWTPWFSVFGSKSGFDSLAECFDDQVEHIYAYETGLSSDPAMNWRVSQLDSLTLISNSDAHSPANIAREANVYDLTDLTYEAVYQLIRYKQADKIKYTIEFYPEEGMYHYDGHRDCDICTSPQETTKLKGICPKCNRPLTVGVDSRVEELADHQAGRKPKGASGFIKLVELDKIIAETLGIKSRQAKKVQLLYRELIERYGSELDILIKRDLNDLKLGGVEPRLVEAVKRVRLGKLIVKPGFDGQYGQIKIFSDEEKRAVGQRSMF